MVKKNSIKSFISKGGGSKGIAIIASKKLSIPHDHLKKLSIHEDEVGKNSTTGIEIGFDADEGKLYLSRIDNSSSGFKICKSESHFEIYCAEVCKAVFEYLNVKLVKAGTVCFDSLTEDDDEDSNHYLIIDVNSHSENPGVLVDA